MASELKFFVAKHCVKDQMPLLDRLLSIDVRKEKVCRTSVRSLAFLWIHIVQSTIPPLLKHRNNSNVNPGRF